MHTVEANYYQASTLLIILSITYTFPVVIRAVNGISFPFFVRSLTLVPCSLFRNRTETLATQAIKYRALKHFVIVPDKIILSRFRRF